MANFMKDQVIFRGEGKFPVRSCTERYRSTGNIVTGELSSHSEADLLRST